MLERVGWQILETTLKENPLSSTQHAFLKGRGTYMALFSMVGTIEEAFENRTFALGVFLDIKGAFDNVSLEAVTNVMRKKGVDHTILTWYKTYLDKIGLLDYLFP